MNTIDFNPLRDSELSGLYKRAREAQQHQRQAHAGGERVANRQADEANYIEAAKQDAATYEARAKIIGLLNAQDIAIADLIRTVSNGIVLEEKFRSRRGGQLISRYSCD
jgi:hypothetical protein